MECCKEIIYVAAQSDMAWLDVTHKCSYILIAVINLVLLWRTFNINRDDANKKEAKGRNIQFFKTLILDYNLKCMYDFFNSIYEESSKLRTSGLDIDNKRTINDNLIEISANFRRSFIDLLSAVDDKLYHKVKQSTDDLIDALTESIFDDGINLSNSSKFNQLISEPIRDCKVNIISTMFNYSGDK